MGQKRENIKEKERKVNERKKRLMGRKGKRNWIFKRKEEETMKEERKLNPKRKEIKEGNNN